MDRRSLIGAGGLLSVLLGLPIEGKASGTNSASQFPYNVPRGEYPNPIFIRDAIQLHFGAALQDKHRLFEGWDDEIVALGMTPTPIGKTDLISFYTAVFNEFPDFRLVDDALLIAGDMAAHRYHALGTHSGGPNPTRSQIMFRGQTLYKLNDHGRVIWRVSNHDHQFREQQLQYYGDLASRASERSWAPDPFAGSVQDLCHPSLVEHERELAIRRKFAALEFNFSNPRTRDEIWRHFTDTATISGLDRKFPLASKTLQHLRDRTQLWTTALPDLTSQTLELIVCGDFVAHSYVLRGTHTNQELYGNKPSGKKVVLREQAIYQLSPSNLIVAIWINHDYSLLSQQFKFIDS